MLSGETVRKVVAESIRELLLEEGDGIPVTIDDSLDLYAIGLNSLELARLVVILGDEFGRDPFGSGEASLANVRTIGDFIAIYERAAAVVEAGA